MGVGGVCTPGQCAAAGVKMPIAKPQAVINPQAVQSTPKPVLERPAGSIDMRV